MVSRRIHHAETAQHVAEQVKFWRKNKGFSQAELGRQMGLFSFQQIQKYETGGNRITVDALAEISRVLDVPISSFFPRPPSKQETYMDFDKQLQMLRDEAGVLENLASALQSTIERLK